MTLTSPIVYWLIALSVVVVSKLFAKDKKIVRIHANIILTLISAFVFWCLIFSSGVQNRLSHTTATLESDKAELLFKLDAATNAIQKQFASKTTGVFSDKRHALPSNLVLQNDKHDFKASAVSILKKSLSESPNSFPLKAKLAIALVSIGGTDNIRYANSLINQIASSKTLSEQKLGKTLLQIYDNQKIAASSVPSLLSSLKSDLNAGWYQDTAIMYLYKSAGDIENSNAYAAQLEDHAVGLFVHLLFILLVAIVVCIIGSIVILIQIFVLPGRNEHKQDDTYWRQGTVWHFKTVYVVFISWLATQLLFGSLAQICVKQLGLFTLGPLLTALSTTVIYAIGNTPGLLYIYWFYCKPANIKFLEAINFKMQSKTLGPFKLITIGFLTWCAAVPIIILAFSFASKFLGAQGSSNPVIALVLETARSSNGIAILIFYLTLGLLAPFCEESLFRGFLYSNLRKRFGAGLSIFFSAFLFAAAHLDIGAFIPLFCLGSLFAFTFERTKSLIPSIIAHGLWNSGTFTLVLILFGN